MVNTGSLGSRREEVRVPKGEALGTFDTYLEAQSVVDRLAKAGYPVSEVSIVGNDLKTVERVTRKLSWGRAAIGGGLSGAWFGLFLGLLFQLVTPTMDLALMGAAVLIGAAFGMFFQLASYAVSRRSRDFDSTKQVLASNYQVIVDPDHLERAREVLARSGGVR